MNINSDINVLGSLPDWNLIYIFLSEDMATVKVNGGIHSYTAIKTDKSVKRFEKAIKSTLISCKQSILCLYTGCSCFGMPQLIMNYLTILIKKFFF